MSEIAVIPLDNRGRAKIEKDPNAVLDYTWDWSQWLEPDADEIISATVTGDGCTIDAFAHDDKNVTAWVSGGVAGTTAKAICHITTFEGREDDRTIYLKIKEK